MDGMCPGNRLCIGSKKWEVTKKVTYNIFKEKLANYVVANVTQGSDIECVILYLEDAKEQVDKEKPNKPTANELRDDMVKWEYQEMFKWYLNRLEQVRTNLKALYSLVWGQCTDALQSVVQTQTDFEAKSRSHDSVWLLKCLIKVVSGVDTKTDPALAICSAFIDLYTIEQRHDESNDRHYRRFMSKIEDIKVAEGESALLFTPLLEVENAIAGATNAKHRQR